MIIGIYKYNRRIYKCLYVFMKFKEIIVTSPVLWFFFKSDISGRNSPLYTICFK
jgi:hypothetical protein